MNIFNINEKKQLSVTQDARIYYSDADSVGENDFAHCRVSLPEAVAENYISTDDGATYDLTAVMHVYTTTVDSEASVENEIELTFSLSDDETEYISDEFTFSDDIICGVGRIDAYIEFTGDASVLGMTNSVKMKIYDVLTNDSETVYPAPGYDVTKLDSVIVKLAALNERLGGLYG